MLCILILFHSASWILYLQLMSCNLLSKSCAAGVEQWWELSPNVRWKISEIALKHILYVWWGSLCLYKTCHLYFNKSFYIIIFQGVSIVMQWVKLPLAMLASYIGASVQVLLLCFCSTISANAPGKTCHSWGIPGWSSWPLASAWPRPGSCGHLGREPVDGKSLSPPLSVLLPFKSVFLKMLFENQRERIPIHSFLKDTSAGSWIRS